MNLDNEIGKGLAFMEWIQTQLDSCLAQAESTYMIQIVTETPRKTTAMTNQATKLDELYPLLKTSTEARMNFDLRMRMEFDNLAGTDKPADVTLDPEIVITPLPANAPESAKNQMELLMTLRTEIIAEETYL